MDRSSTGLVQIMNVSRRFDRAGKDYRYVFETGVLGK